MYVKVISFLLKNVYIVISFTFIVIICREVGLSKSDFGTSPSSAAGVLHADSSSSSGLSAGVMAVLVDLLLPMLLLTSAPPGGASPSCPLGCRCYSLTVECGSTLLRDVPKHIPPSTQVCRCFILILSDLHQTFMKLCFFSPSRPSSSRTTSSARSVDMTSVC